MSFKLPTFLIRSFLRSKLSVITLIFVFLIFQVYFFRQNDDLYYLKGELSESQLIEKLKGVDRGNKVYINDHNSDISTTYTDLMKEYGETFNNYQYHNKCDIYFKSLYKTDQKWTLTDFHDLPYNGQIFEKKGDFIKDRLKEYKEKHHKDLKDEEFEEIAKKEDLSKSYELAYNAAVKETAATERKLIDASTHLRVYGACYLDQYGKFNELKSGDPKVEQQCYDIEMRMFPWLSRMMPTYTRWDGTESKIMPVISKYIDQENDYSPVNTNCYMKNLKHQLNGKGIAISAKDSHFDQLAALLSLLRALGNRLPIQIVHKGDLGKKVQKQLIDIARMDYPNLEHVDHFEAVLAQRNITNFDESNKTQIIEIFPKQELWFVNVDHTISDAYKGKFNTYANKFLAYFFNSFKECVLMDTDTVPLVDIESKILGSPAYRKHGAYFFKDRELFYQGVFSDRKFFSKLMPSKIDTAFFGIPKSTDFTMKNRFIGGRFFHYQESGIVAVNKARHMTGVLTTLQLQIWAPAASKVWGDKELFWLGLSIAGDEDYSMNQLAAGSVGQLTPKSQKLHNGKEVIGRELCSTHPAHVSGDDNSTLLWFNAGFQYCKKDTYQGDYKSSHVFRNLFKDEEELKKYYKGYLKIDAAVVPKHAEFYVGNDKGENPRGWGSMNECGGYMFCAYDKVGGRDDPSSNGVLVEFDEEQRKVYDFYGSVWINGMSIFYEPTKKSKREISL